MASKTSPKSIEYIESNFSTLNAHADGIVDNERQLSRLKRFKADRALIKNICIVFLALGLLAILLGIAYNRAQAPVIEVVEKPVYIDRPEYIVIKVPDPEKSIVKEIPVYIEKIVKVPIQVGNVTDFTFFNTKIVGKEGIARVTVGANYEDVNSPYPEKQWCYASVTKNISDNSYNDISLARKSGKGAVIYNKITKQDSAKFGASISAIEKAKEYCEFFPDSPPIESEGPATQIPSKPLPSQPPSSGGKSGTGFFINNNGYLITNYHVVDSCSSIWIDDGNSQIQASIIRANEGLDIAALKIDKKTSIYAIFGQVRTGEDVLALGFPLSDILGDEIKATKGVVSALVGYQGNKDYLQFTAPIQSGNSGGPLLNEGGFVIGINTANLVGEEFQNINFAIKGTSALSFLGQYGIEFEHIESQESMNSADIVEQASEYTVRVLCYD